MIYGIHCQHCDGADWEQVHLTLEAAKAAFAIEVAEYKSQTFNWANFYCERLRLIELEPGVLPSLHGAENRHIPAILDWSPTPAECQEPEGAKVFAGNRWHLLEGLNLSGVGLGIITAYRATDGREFRVPDRYLGDGNDIVVAVLQCLANR